MREIDQRSFKVTPREGADAYYCDECADVSEKEQTSGQERYPGVPEQSVSGDEDRKMKQIHAVGNYSQFPQPFPSKRATNRTARLRDRSYEHQGVECGHPGESEYTYATAERIVRVLGQECHADREDNQPTIDSFRDSLIRPFHLSFLSAIAASTPKSRESIRQGIKKNALIG